MKYTIKTLFFLSIILLAVGCNKKTHDLNQDFMLDFDKKSFIQIDGKKVEIKFTKLVEDSRCAPGKQCIWAGTVAVKVKLDKNTDIIFGDGLNYPPSSSYKNHQIILLDVMYDSEKNFGKEKHCRIRLRVN